MIKSSVGEISNLIETSKGATALAEQKLWNLVHCHPEKIAMDAHHDLAVVAGCLSAIGRQYEAFLQMMEGMSV